MLRSVFLMRLRHVLVIYCAAYGLVVFLDKPV